MQVWAITGGIACGKSAVAAHFGRRGARVRSADEDARAVLEEPELVAALRDAFPAAVDPSGVVDRAALAQTIYADPDARTRLNALIHPAIRQRMRAAIDAARADAAPGLLLYEVPLLYEGGLETWFDGVVAVWASPDAQAQRLQSRESHAGRPPLTDEQIAQRLASQLPVQEKARRADIAVNTDGPWEQTRAQLDRLWDERFAAG